ncbi:MAG: hypothetical protein B5766_02310 [Candidatus Lumbricidophila eiseniae]|uniref:Uncharacterized protein n=1 Tax=Candidatus Lumbricidiphila eiseniae TaxID=1969409 RepID=A0A2A6FTF7_9MICO|nr:MAG: hypothetical protein B5766_02310 [Candidatus Lumbricidophila eiseniae]
MPLVTIVLRPHSAEKELLTAVANAVAQALALGIGEVIAIATPVSGIVASGGVPPVGQWLIATVHGSDRGEEEMRTGLTELERAIRDWATDNNVVMEGVWTEWVLPHSR